MRTARTLLLAAVLAAGLAVPAAGQFSIPYYGKNKVSYERFPWKSYSTEHFQIFFYAADPAVLERVAGMAESSYKKISTELKHALNDPVPLLYYTTFTDFEMSNVFQISEGVLGVSEPALHRIGVHGDMAEDELQSLITHELSHIFEFDLLWGSPSGNLYAVSEPPLWTFEGLSEYMTGEWSSWSTLILRDTVLSDRIPDFSESGELYSRYPLPREPAYDFGHAIYEFITERYGKNAPREFFASLKGASPLLGRRDPIKKAFRVEPRQFSQEFKRYLRARFKEYATRENPEDYSIPLGPEFPMNPYYFAFSHAVSPSGDLVATITFNAKASDIDIVLLSTRDGKIVKNITQGFTSRYEYIRYEIDPSLGRSLAWSRDGDTLAFFARDGRRHSLFLVDVRTGDIVKRLPLALDQPVSPAFTPDGRSLLFSAFDRGARDIFRIDAATGVVANLTADAVYEKAPALSPDGTRIAYSVRIDGQDKLVLSPIEDLSKKRQLTFGKGNTVTPEFSPDGKTLYFSGDERGAYNLYSLDLQTGDLRRFTDVRTGIFFPGSLPDRPGTRLFSAFNKGAFQLFLTDNPGVPEERLTFVDIEPGALVKPFAAEVKVAVDKEKIVSQEGMGKLYVAARPPADAIVSTDGSIYGGSTVTFSDLLANHMFTISAYQVRDFRSMFFTYVNLSRRLQWMATAFQYTLFYYPDYYYYDASLWNYATYQDALSTRRITGATIMAYYPLSKFVRAEGSLGFAHYEEDVLDPYAYGMSSALAYSYFLNGEMLSASFGLTGETTRFREYGPISGRTFSISVSQTLPVVESFISNTTLTADLRQYVPIGANTLFAVRFRGFASLGRDRFIGYYGGNNDVRSSYYYNLVGTSYWFANAEFRLPLIDTAQTIIGAIGPVRGTLFFDVSKRTYGDLLTQFYRWDTDADGNAVLVAAEAIGSYGAGVEFFLFGLPFHLEFAKRLEWTSLGKPFSFSATGAWMTKFWIGYDF
jgi:dipeptidyl aminopeptidase/acylaminoacyl peptidase